MPKPPTSFTFTIPSLPPGLYRQLKAHVVANRDKGATAWGVVCEALRRYFEEEKA